MSAASSAERWLAQQAAGAGGRSRTSGSPQVHESDENLGPGMSSGSPEMFFRTGNERLYEAYNELHSLAQDFQKPFDAPAILVVGHQTDGKSALVEALMGFQFNHVGGGTKTRRPITLHMKYNASCEEPNCYLITEDRGEMEVTLEELQEYIESENRRLEKEADKFWAKEIVVKIEYKYCPNLTIIDTPGLISAAPGKRHGALQSSARQVEAMVKSKMQQQEYIVLCLEDTSDWSNATTRRLVMQVDPELRRTVIVSTKFDTRIPQFSRGADVETFLRPPARVLEPAILGGVPFFTSVPSGRVGSARDSMFPSNDDFREAVGDREAHDCTELERRLDRRLEPHERARIGVSQLRRFLEQLLQRRYLENVPAIVPVLEQEHRVAASKLRSTMVELNDLDTDRLKERGRAFREAFLGKLSLLLRGTVAAPPERFGETLADEHLRGGAFVGSDGKPLPSYAQLPNQSMRLYGGAQYHRAMAEFRHCVGQLTCPAINAEEIVNACGVDDVHDGVNYTRTACVIAVAKAREAFEPYLHQLGYRLAHVVRRMLPAAIYLLQKDGDFLLGHELFLKRVGGAFHAFVEDQEKDCRSKCLEDLTSTTRYVSWALHNKHKEGIRAMLSASVGEHVSSAAAAGASELPAAGTDSGGKGRGRGRGSGGGDATPPPAQAEKEAKQKDLVDLLESTLWSRQLGMVSEDIVYALVNQIFEGIRDHMVMAAELKFNCFFLMPVVDTFPMRLRDELEKAYEDDVDSVFDVGTVRANLEKARRSLESEVTQVESIQKKFQHIHSTLTHPQPSPRYQPAKRHDASPAPAPRNPLSSVR